MKYIIQIYEGEINGHREKEGLPTEFQYEFEQEMLKHIHDLKKDLRERRDGFKERILRFTRPHFWGVMIRMLSWDLSLNENNFWFCVV